MLDPVNEKSEWVRDQLASLWGENEADYFTNPARLVNKSDDLVKSNLSKDPSANLSIAKKSQKGLYAYAIWDSLREEANNRLKSFDMDKELQQTMNMLKNDSNFKLEEEEEVLRINRPTDMSKIKQTKIYRNEIELMYRSSKMNEERSNMLRVGSPLPDINDNEGKESIVRYLPSIDLSEDYNKAPKRTPTFEPSMRHRYKRHIENKQSQQSDNVNYTIIDFKSKNSARLDTQNVKLKFMTDKPISDYFAYKSSDYAIDNLSLFDNTKADNNSKSLVLYDDEPRQRDRTASSKKFTKDTYPPLTLNALMEYKPLIKAPGLGEFDNGKPKLFRLPET